MIRAGILAMALAILPLAALAQAEQQQPVPRGQQLFTDRCGGCHLEGGFGTRVLARRVPAGEAKLEDRSALPAAYTMAVVRRGLGSMPQIRAAELGDEDLAAIAAYLEERP